MANPLKWTPSALAKQGLSPETVRTAAQELKEKDPEIAKLLASVAEKKEQWARELDERTSKLLADYRVTAEAPAAVLKNYLFLVSLARGGSERLMTQIEKQNRLDQQRKGDPQDYNGKKSNYQLLTLLEEENVKGKGEQALNFEAFSHWRDTLDRQLRQWQKATVRAALQFAVKEKIASIQVGGRPLEMADVDRLEWNFDKAGLQRFSIHGQPLELTKKTSEEIARLLKGEELLHGLENPIAGASLPKAFLHKTGVLNQTLETLRSDLLQFKTETWDPKAVQERLQAITRHYAQQSGAKAFYRPSASLAELGDIFSDLTLTRSPGRWTARQWLGQMNPLTLSPGHAASDQKIRPNPFRKLVLPVLLTAAVWEGGKEAYQQGYLAPLSRAIESRPQKTKQASRFQAVLDRADLAPAVQEHLAQPQKVYDVSIKGNAKLPTHVVEPDTDTLKEAIQPFSMSRGTKKAVITLKSKKDRLVEDGKLLLPILPGWKATQITFSAEEVFEQGKDYELGITESGHAVLEFKTPLEATKTQVSYEPDDSSDAHAEFFLSPKEVATIAQGYEQDGFAPYAQALRVEAETATRKRRWISSRTVEKILDDEGYYTYKNRQGSKGAGPFGGLKANQNGNNRLCAQCTGHAENLAAAFRLGRKGLTAKVVGGYLFDATGISTPQHAFVRVGVEQGTETEIQYYDSTSHRKDPEAALPDVPAFDSVEQTLKHLRTGTDEDRAIALRAPGARFSEEYLAGLVQNPNISIAEKAAALQRPELNKPEVIEPLLSNLELAPFILRKRHPLSASSLQTLVEALDTTSPASEDAAEALLERQDIALSPAQIETILEKHSNIDRVAAALARRADFPQNLIAKGLNHPAMVPHLIQNQYFEVPDAIVDEAISTRRYDVLLALLDRPTATLSTHQRSKLRRSFPELDIFFNPPANIPYHSYNVAELFSSDFPLFVKKRIVDHVDLVTAQTVNDRIWWTKEKPYLTAKVISDPKFTHPENFATDPAVDPLTRRAALRHPNYDPGPEKLRQLALDSRLDEATKLALLENPHIPQDVLHWIALDPKQSGTLRRRAIDKLVPDSLQLPFEETRPLPEAKTKAKSKHREQKQRKARIRSYEKTVTARKEDVTPLANLPDSAYYDDRPPVPMDPAHPITTPRSSVLGIRPAQPQKLIELKKKALALGKWGANELAPHTVAARAALDFIRMVEGKLSVDALVKRWSTQRRFPKKALENQPPLRAIVEAWKQSEAEWVNQLRSQITQTPDRKTRSILGAEYLASVNAVWDTLLNDRWEQFEERADLETDCRTKLRRLILMP